MRLQKILNLLLSPTFFFPSLSFFLSLSLCLFLFQESLFIFAFLFCDIIERINDVQMSLFVVKREKNENRVKFSALPRATKSSRVVITGFDYLNHTWRRELYIHPYLFCLLYVTLSLSLFLSVSVLRMLDNNRETWITRKSFFLFFFFSNYRECEIRLYSG